jgi:hypothetical protein
MFDREYDITGKHAIFTRFLSRDMRNTPDKGKGVFGHYGLFERYLDVYLNGAIFGLLYDRTAPRDTSMKGEEANIPASAFNTSRNECVFLYRLVMLLEQTTGITPEERIDRAFRYDADEKYADQLAANMNLFHSYVLGGIEVLYEKFTDGTTTPDDYLEKVFMLMSDFQEEIQGISYEEKLAQLMK